MEWIVISWHPACPHWNGEMWTGSSERSFRLLLRNSRKSMLVGPNRSNTKIQGGWRLALMCWIVLGLALALETFFLAEVIASPRGEAIWALSALALLSSALSLSEVVSLLAPESASTLASQLRVFTAGGEAIAASLITSMSALPLALREKRGWALWRA